MSDELKVPDWIIEAMKGPGEEKDGRKVVEIVFDKNQKIRILRKIVDDFHYDHLLMISVAPDNETRNSATVSWRYKETSDRLVKSSYVLASVLKEDIGSVTTNQTEHQVRQKESSLFDYLRQYAPKIFEYFLWNKI